MNVRRYADMPTCNGQNQPATKDRYAHIIETSLYKNCSCLLIKCGCCTFARSSYFWPIHSESSSIRLVDECVAFTTPKWCRVHAIWHTFYTIHYELPASACLRKLQFSQYRRHKMRRIARIAFALRGRMSTMVFVPNIRLYCLSTIQAKQHNNFYIYTI